VGVVIVGSGQPRAPVAGVPDVVEVGVLLPRVGDVRTVVASRAQTVLVGIGRRVRAQRAEIAGVRRSISIRVRLGGIRHGRTVVAHVAHAVVILIFLSGIW